MIFEIACVLLFGTALLLYFKLDDVKKTSKKKIDELEEQNLLFDKLATANAKTIIEHENVIRDLTKTIGETQNTIKEYSAALEKGQSAINLALSYEDFYYSTVIDIGQVVDKLNEVVEKRQVLSDDPEVQNFLRMLAIAHDTLLAYVNAKSKKELPQVQEQKNEQ